MNVVRANSQIILKRLTALSIVSLLACILASCGKKEEAAPESSSAAAPAAVARKESASESSRAAPPSPVANPAESQSRTFEIYSKMTKQETQSAGEHKTARRAPAGASEAATAGNGETGATARHAPAAASEAPVSESAADYKVKLGADPVLTIPGPPGELKVWIGLPAYEPQYLGLTTKVDTLPAAGKTARVTPFAPGLKVKPDTSICMKINPKGSEVRFELIPVESGTFKVGADVALFDSGDCSGAPIPKATTTLQVDVSVDRVKLTLKYMGELWEVFWKKLLEFWGAALALFFGALLFLFRKKLKKWFGYTE